MIISKILFAVCIIFVIIQTIIGICMYVSDVIAAKKNKNTCIHTESDCEECISQTGCPYKENNVVKLRKEH